VQVRDLTLASSTSCGAAAQACMWAVARPLSCARSLSALARVSCTPQLTRFLFHLICTRFDLH
jgi:hypothetical protein